MEQKQHGKAARMFAVSARRRLTREPGEPRNAFRSAILLHAAGFASIWESRTRTVAVAMALKYKLG